MNLFKPYQAVKEAYQASDPARGRTDWRESEVPEFLSFWWLSYLANWAVAFVAVERGTETARLLSSVVELTALVLTFVLVTAMLQRQKDKARSPN
jgi:Domain of unknown function (DUF4328)